MISGASAREVVRADQPALQQPHDEGARTREGVEGVHPLVAQGGSELPPQEFGDRANDEVDDLDRGVDDAEALHVAGEGRLKEAVVEFGHDALAGFAVIDALHAALDRGVEVLQLGGLGLQPLPVQLGEHPLHDLRDRVAGGELRSAEQRHPVTVVGSPSASAGVQLSQIKRFCWAANVGTVVLTTRRVWRSSLNEETGIPPER